MILRREISKLLQLQRPPCHRRKISVPSPLTVLRQPPRMRSRWRRSIETSSKQLKPISLQAWKSHTATECALNLSRASSKRPPITLLSASRKRNSATLLRLLQAKITLPVRVRPSAMRRSSSTTPMGNLSCQIRASRWYLGQKSLNISKSSSGI